MRLASLAALVLASAGAQAQDASALSALSWLSGCWRAEAAEGGTVEQWLAPAGGTMLGVGRTVKGGKTVAHEFMRIAADDQGKLAFTTMPSGKSSATFTSIAHDDSGITFELQRDDFPQRVIYKKAGPDKLAARIEGMRNGQLRGIDFPMRRC